ncbi:hypothetical protein [Motilimonas sp. E26]|uniref:hypothetical protein n=1 Tax=Motilimonas sp. E26 TaxID=2865674 RepID=UPI001E4BA5B4|nr:hypothetical protein [Motilimonas sp. E26]MCE0559422.1 hypothetical protein [Motilimonas sp. E26]
MDLLRKIVRVWDALEVPKIVSVDTYDDEGACVIFSGSRFDEHSDETINCHLSSFTFMTDESFRYYFGSLLITAIRDGGESIEVMALHLEAPKGDISRPSFSQKIGGFSAEQLECIREVLEVLINRGDMFDDALAVTSVRQLLT